MTTLKSWKKTIINLIFYIQWKYFLEIRVKIAISYELNMRKLINNKIVLELKNAKDNAIRRKLVSTENNTEQLTS